MHLIGCERPGASRVQPGPRVETADPESTSTVPAHAVESRSVETLDWSFPDEFGGPKRCGLLVPRPIRPGARLPILIALHGLGETSDPKTGAFGWIESYRLEAAYRRLLSPPLSREDFGGLVTDERLAAINADLAARPFAGLIVATPYIPRDVTERKTADLFARWFEERLLPRIGRELPGDPRRAGIDGVSLGGLAALELGIARPDLFIAIGALQPAISDPTVADRIAKRIAEGLGERPLRLVTSTEDVYRPAILALDAKLSSLGVAHETEVTVGPHDYAWNRGPGAIEMLLFHDRALRR